MADMGAENQHHHDSSFSGDPTPQACDPALKSVYDSPLPVMYIYIYIIIYILLYIYYI